MSARAFKLTDPVNWLITADSVMGVAVVRDCVSSRAPACAGFAARCSSWVPVLPARARGV